MSTDLELALRRALDATDGVVRAPERDLIAGAKRDHRRRRTARWGAAGLVAVAAASAAIAVARPDATGRPATTPTASPRPNVVRLDPSTARPIEDVWPRAVRTLPGRLPDGSDYTVVEEVAPGSFVVQARTGRDRYGSVYRFEPAKGALSVLIDAGRLNPSTNRGAPVGLAAVLDGRYVAVQTLEDEGEPSIVEVVAVADGSPVARVDLPAGTEVGIMDWADGHLLWTPNGDAAVHSAVDPPDPIPGSNGYHLIGRGAWAVAERSGWAVEWWKVGTSERHKAPAPGSPLACYGTACVTDDAASTLLRIVSIDGPGGVAQTAEGDSYLAPVGDHFCVVEYRAIASGHVRLLWNLHTNTYALLPTVVEPMEIAGVDILVLSSNADRKVVVNLAAID